MSVIVKCKSCNGTGYIPMGNGVRGLLVCKACNGVGKYENDEITIINDEYYYKIPNGTSYVYETIPKEFKPYFDKLQQENKQLKEKMAEIVKYKELESCSTATQYMAKANVYKMYDTHIKKLEEINDKLKQQLDLYKSVIEELRQELSIIDDDIMKTCEIYDVNGIELKKILDKVSDSDE